MLRMKRVYQDPEPDDGVRILVDQVWPRGLTKEKAKVDEWRKELAPSDELRKWYGHDPVKWEEFRQRYRKEIEQEGKLDELHTLKERAQWQNVTLVFAASDEAHSNAAVLRDLIEAAGT